MSRLKKRGKYTDPKYRASKDSDLGYSYRNIVIDVYHTPSEKQMELIKGLKATCENVGIDLSGLRFNLRDRNGASSAIRALYTILGKHGYDGWGNPLNESEKSDTN